MTSSSSSSSLPSTSVGLWRPKLRVWVVVAAFVLGLGLGLQRPPLSTAVAIVAVVALLLLAAVAYSPSHKPLPQRLHPLGLSPVFSIKLSGTALAVGRSEGCDVTLPVETVSARHCRVYRKRSAWFVEDLGSRNGTRVNGKAVRRGRLRVGDTLSIADFHFRVC